MIIRYIFSSLIILLTFSHAEFDSKVLDKYHDDISFWLVDTSNTLDDYLTESNSTQTSKTHAEVQTSFAVESTQPNEYAIRLKLRLDLPKIRKQLRVVFEDATSDDTLYDGTVLNSDYHIEEKSYYLRFDYFKYIKKELNLSAGAGVRFRKSSLHPYINIKAKYHLHKSDKEKVLLSNRFRLYVDGDIENITAFRRLWTIGDSLYYTFNNTFRYRSWENSQKIVNGASFVKSFGLVERATIGASLVSELENKSIQGNYYSLYINYKNLLYKDWVYYELNPSLMRREENHFNTSYRFMVNLGVLFKTD
jgi:hypothetical protein